MSQETYEHLNNWILVGYTDKRGSTAWHYRLELQGKKGGKVAELGLGSNHFPGAIPVEIARRFFDLHISPRQVYVRSDITGLLVELADYRAWCANDDDSCMGVHSDGYQGHQYGEWLVENVLELVNGTTGLGSLGYLQNRAVAFASIEMPDNVKTKEGVEFRPFLMATTSFNGQIPTLYKRCKTFPLCDNTMNGALHEKGQEYRIKHTRNSLLRIADAREALAILQEGAEQDAAAIAAQCEYGVTEAQWEAFLTQLVPLPEVNEHDINKRDYSTRGATIAANKRERLNQLYFKDGRASPWKGTAFGVAMAVNTYNQHYATVRNESSRYARNMDNVISGKTASQDNDAMALLTKICERELVAA